MSMLASRALEHKSELVIPHMFQDLMGQSRVDLFEISSEADSLLTEEFRARTGRSDSACRSALWSGQDLSTPEGLALILEQIRCIHPKHVWIALPGDAFSSLQNLNQKTPTQVRDLKAKRALAIRYYESTEEITKVCMQAGIHVTLELGEKSEAWRLPVLQRLRLNSGLFTCVTKGCSVGLKGNSGRLLQKGWRLVTTHQRLSEKLQKPCRCPTNYEHGRCTGSSARSSSRYTPELRRLVVEALDREGDLAGIVHECQGESLLPESFGFGLQCDCHGKPNQRICGCCIVRDQEAPRDPSQTPEAAYMSTEEVKHLEEAARSTLKGTQAPSLPGLEHLLSNHPIRNLGKSRRSVNQANDYQVFGTYAFGNHYGNTNRTRSLPELCKYINKVLKQHLPHNMKWTSFAINHGTSMPLHRDINNSEEHPNGSIGFGNYTGGGLWIEGQGSLCGRQGVSSERKSPQGFQVQGMEYDIRKQAVVFHPKSWHCSCPWEGDRWVVTAFVSRGWEHLSPGELQELKDLGFPTPQSPKQQAYPAEAQSREQERRKEDERIRKKLYLLHCATGHSHPKHMVQALKRRGVDGRTLELAEQFTCAVCKEQQRPPPRNLAALEPLPPKLYTISADIGHWVHPHDESCHQFMIVIDEGSRFRAAKILSSGSKKSPNAQECLSYLHEGWIQYFGHPRALRLDPAGAFRSAAVEAWCDKHAIHLDIIPGEAHWKIGTVENAVRGLKELMTKLCHYDHELAPQEALAEAVWAFNHRELIRGYSPAQHILGQAPDETGRFIPASGQEHPNLLVENPSGEFQGAAQRRAEAEKALSDWTAKQRIMRAQHSRHRGIFNFEPGELVYYWRTQDANKGRRQPGGKHGRFLGPARILATETRRDPDGGLRAGSSVWLVKGRSLLKCAPEQLRRATEREELVEALTAPTEGATPWTFHSVAKEIGGNKYEDISSELPPEDEWARAQQAEEEIQPTRHRLRGKRPAPPASLDDDEEAATETREPAGPSGRDRSRSRGEHEGLMVDLPAAWWSDVPETKWPEQQAGYWNDRGAAVELEFTFPESQRGRDRAFLDLGAYFVGNMRRRAVELSERRLTPAERESFQGAKAIEVKNFVASKAFEILPDHLKPDKSQAIGMRWILTWKLREDGSRKAKARAVLLGYQDSGYEHRKTTSPVMTRTTRQALLQLSAWKRWKVQKGDVTGAFLQSRQYPDELFCIPCPEICEALGVKPGSITRVKRACYCLVDAPLEWYRSVDEFLRSLGFQRTWADACCWVLREKGEIRGAVSGHVDDFLFCGKSGDPLWEEKLKAIQSKFKWGDWESGRFTQCGVIIEQKEEGFELSQPSYLDNLKEIGVNASRRKDRSQPTTDKEKSQLRALLGGISWHAQQVAPYLAAEVGLLLTEVSRSTVDTIVKANILLSHAKSKKDHIMKIHSFKESDTLTLVSWVDAAQGNRADGGSTQGISSACPPTTFSRARSKESVLWHGPLRRSTEPVVHRGLVSPKPP